MYIPRYVIDTMEINAKRGLPSMNELERLHDLRIIEIFCTSTSNVEFRPKPLQKEKSKKYRRIGSAFGPVKFTQRHGPDATWGAPPRKSRLEEIHQIVFGTPFPKNNKDHYNITSFRDALHLDQCWSNMVDVFITEDKTILNSRSALLEKGFDFQIFQREECVEFTRHCLRRWYGTIDDGEITKTVSDLSRPIVVGSNSTAAFSISIGEESPVLALQLGTNCVQVKAYFRDASGAPLLTILPNRAYEFHQPTVQVQGARANGANGIKLGCKYYMFCSIGSTAEDQPPFWNPSDDVLMAAFVSRSGHVVFFAGSFRDSKGDVRATINKESLKLIGASLSFKTAPG